MSKNFKKSQKEKKEEPEEEAEEEGKEASHFYIYKLPINRPSGRYVNMLLM